MTGEPEGQPNGDPKGLRQKGDALLSPGVWKWLVTVLLPGILIPLVVTLVIHVFIDRPAERDEFEGQFDYRFDAATKSHSYVLKISNTGWRRATDALGNAEVHFNAKITAIDKISVPPNTTFGDRQCRDAHVCQASNSCRINWGGLVPEGSLEIVFYTEGPPSRFPTVRYGGKRISKWRCSNLPDHLSAYCVGIEP